jgi:hypothetical protein
MIFLVLEHSRKQWAVSRLVGLFFCLASVTRALGVGLRDRRLESVLNF